LLPAQIDELAQRYVEGETVLELAAAFGVHRTTVIGHLRARGVVTRYRKVSERDVIKAAKLRAEGWTFAEIGAHFGVQPSTVLNRLRQAQPKPRSTSSR
jgi:DNA-directed RNA polymerase specialized sigma24 family protein